MEVCFSSLEGEAEVWEFCGGRLLLFWTAGDPSKPPCVTVERVEEAVLLADTKNEKHFKKSSMKIFDFDSVPPHLLCYVRIRTGLEMSKVKHNNHGRCHNSPTWGYFHDTGRCGTFGHLVLAGGLVSVWSVRLGWCSRRSSFERVEVIVWAKDKNSINLKHFRMGQRHWFDTLHSCLHRITKFNILGPFVFWIRIC